MSTQAGPEAPMESHATRKGVLETEALGYARSFRLISTLRLVTFVGAASLALVRGFGYLSPAFSYAAGALGVAFLALVFAHIRVDRRVRRVEAAIDYHRWAIERLLGNFENYPSRGDRFASDDHPYTSDLGIFGPGSVFQLIDATRTRRGEDRLAHWLSEPSDSSEIGARQTAVRELVGRETLREELGVEGALIAADKPNPDPLLAWAEADAKTAAIPIPPIVAFAVPLATAIVLALTELHVLPMGYLLVAIGAQWAFSFWLLPKVEPIAGAVSSREGALARYRAMLALLEKSKFEAPRLRELLAEIGVGQGAAASEEIRRLSRIVGFLDARQNEVFKLFIGPLLLWDVHCVLALERWRARAGRNVRRWLDAIGEVEALASLAGFAHDHPEHSWPKLSDAPTFRAKGLGHPLLAPKDVVRNDVTVRGAGTALLVTGSNMSGKSTLLRSMGVNAVLAMAGAPVVAHELEIAPLAVRTSMWARDSLVKGVSHFYAELQKLKRVVDGLGGKLPVFFLLDEILQGTNSRERVIGARSVLRHLLEHGAMGAVSTHDAGLLELPPELEPRLDKVHFEEQVRQVNGTSTMTFDYRLRPGVVRSSNALRLMKLVGIDVEIE